MSSAPPYLRVMLQMHGWAQRQRRQTGESLWLVGGPPAKEQRVISGITDGMVGRAIASALYKMEDLHVMEQIRRHFSPAASDGA